MIEENPLSEIRIGQVSHEWAQSQKIKSFYFPSTESTNVIAKSNAFKPDMLAEQLAVYFADAQTAGRGRGSNTWTTSHPGSQLLATWSFMLQDHVQPILSPLVGLSLYKAAVSTWPFIDFNLKAPNDLYIGDKKVGGILLETVSQGDDIRLLVGLGLNVLAHPKEIATSTSLMAALPKSSPLLAQDWISFLERFIFELSLAIQLASEPLDTTTTTALTYVLNKHPLLKDKYTRVDEDGNLFLPTKKINWLDL